jgi:hypothetical protein
MNSMLWMGTGIARRATRHLFLRLLGILLMRPQAVNRPCSSAQFYCTALHRESVLVESGPVHASASS